MPTERKGRSIENLGTTKPATRLGCATYKHHQVADLFGVNKATIYDWPDVMACRIPKRRGLYSKAKIDALLGITQQVA